MRCSLVTYVLKKGKVGKTQLTMVTEFSFHPDKIVSTLPVFDPASTRRWSEHSTITVLPSVIYIGYSIVTANHSLDQSLPYYIAMKTEEIVKLLFNFVLVYIYSFVCCQTAVTYQKVAFDISPLWNGSMINKNEIFFFFIITFMYK